MVPAPRLCRSPLAIRCEPGSDWTRLKASRTKEEWQSGWMEILILVVLSRHNLRSTLFLSYESSVRPIGLCRRSALDCPGVVWSSWRVKVEMPELLSLLYVAALKASP